MYRSERRGGVKKSTMSDHIYKKIELVGSLVPLQTALKTQ
jgi:hypothetical protein